MNRPAYNLLKKITRMRTYLLNNNIGKKNLELILKLDKISIWVNAWPNAPENGCINYIRKNYNDLVVLIPSCNASKKLMFELNSLVK
jgi:hypothetical protein